MVFSDSGHLTVFSLLAPKALYTQSAFCSLFNVYMSITSLHRANHSVTWGWGGGVANLVLIQSITVLLSAHFSAPGAVTPAGNSCAECDRRGNWGSGSWWFCLAAQSSSMGRMELTPSSAKGVGLSLSPLPILARRNSDDDQRLLSLSSSSFLLLIYILLNDEIIQYIIPQQLCCLKKNWEWSN